MIHSAPDFSDLLLYRTYLGVGTRCIKTDGPDCAWVLQDGDGFSDSIESFLWGSESGIGSVITSVTLEETADPNENDINSLRVYSIVGRHYDDVLFEIFVSESRYPSGDSLGIELLDPTDLFRTLSP